MTYKASAIIEKIRDLISDTVPDYRWTDATMLDWLNEGAAAVYEAHPEFYYTDTVVTSPPDLLISVDSELSTTQTGQKLVINYVAFRCLLRDNEDPETLAQATKFLELYTLAV